MSFIMCVVQCHQQTPIKITCHLEFFVTELIFISGSEKPAEVEGHARLYSMAYCPFAHRIRLVLSLKQIPHDIVNINLQSKPQWFLQVYNRFIFKRMTQYSDLKRIFGYFQVQILLLTYNGNAFRFIRTARYQLIQTWMVR